MKLILKLYLSLNKTSVALASLFTCKAPDGAVASVMECMASTKYIKAELLPTLSDAKFYSICYDRSSGMSCHPTKPPPPFGVINLSSLPPSPVFMTAATNAFFYYTYLGTNSYTVLVSFGRNITR